MKHSNALEALKRAVVLLRATSEFIDKNPVAEYTVFYDEAECDGYCLGDDCDVAREEAEAAISQMEAG